MSPSRAASVGLLVVAPIFAACSSKQTHPDPVPEQDDSSPGQFVQPDAGPFDGASGDATDAARDSIADALVDVAPDLGGDVPVLPPSTCGSFDPKQVFLWGTLSKTEVLPSIVHLGTPSQPCVGPGLPYAGGFSFQRVLNSSDGSVRYVATSDHAVHVFRSSAFVWSGDRWAYPTDKSSDPDSVVETPDCPTGVYRLYGSPDSSRLIYTCAPDAVGAPYHDGGTKKPLPPPSSILHAVGYGGALFFSDTFGPKLIDATGATQLVVGIPSGETVKVGRGRADGSFNAATIDGASVVRFYQVSTVGVASALGTAAAPPAGVTLGTRLDEAVFDFAGALYVGATSGSDRVILKFAASPSSVEVVYTEASATKTDWTTTPPQTFTYDYSSLLTAQ